jgi:hypothetical protein
MPPLEEVLKSEFDLIQTKLDNIGEFKFRVKGWSVTLLTGIIVALFSGKVTDAVSGYQVLVLGAPILSIIFLFQWLEQQQDKVASGLAKRAVVVERALEVLTIPRADDDRKRQAISRGVFKRLALVPRVAITMRLAAQGSQFKGMFHWRTNLFYHIQYFLAISLVFWIFYMGPKTSQQAPDFLLNSFDINGESFRGAIKRESIFISAEKSLSVTQN